ncbi:MAG: endolytic transglycosylase MltG [Acidobacteriota bacterium]|nr:endolytic transglycosylase MltG [Acidobacteriota bacterium]
MRVIALLTVIALVIVAAYMTIVLPRAQARLLEAPDASPGAASVVFVVKSGQTAGQIARALEEAELIRSAKAFQAMLKRKDWGTKLKPGVYRLERSQNAEQIARRMVNQETWRIRVSIPEGLTLKQIAQKIEKAGAALTGGPHLPSAAEIRKAATAQAVERRLGARVPTPTAEGYLFPATYEFPAGASASEVVDEMLTAFRDRFLSRNQDAIERSGRSLHEIVTLAAIVEREAAADKERPLVARVFLNRIDIGMKLESCATVQYALGGHKARLLYEDLKVDSPYNTYIHRGLPPGPICSPGEASLLAALKPGETDALYFVSRNDGTHAFSRTFAEHQRAINQIRSR